MRNLFLIRDASVNLRGKLTQSCDNSGKHKIEQIVKQMYDIIAKQMQETSYKESKNGLYLLYSAEPVAEQTAKIIKDKFGLRQESFEEKEELWLDEKKYLEKALHTVDDIIALHDNYFSIVVCANNEFIIPYKNHIIKTESIEGKRFKITQKYPGAHFDLKLGTYKVLLK